MEEHSLQKLYSRYINRSAGFRKIEYNWRDVALYALAVGAKENQRQYFYEKYLQVIPTFGAIPCYNAVNNEPQHPLPETAFMPLWDELNQLEGRQVLGLDFDHEIIFHRPIDGIKGSFVFEDKIIGLFDRGDKGIVVKTMTPVYDEAGRLICENFGNAALMAGGNFGGKAFPKSPVIFPESPADVTVDDYISPTQHALYRLTGDTNLIHIDDEYAKEQGMERAIMQGFCPMGFACRMAVEAVIPGEPERAKRMKVQFRSICYPGTEIQFKG